MKAHYDKYSDTLTLKFNEKPVDESDEVRPGVILDFSADGSIVGVEILAASSTTEMPSAMDFAVAV